MDAKQTPHIWSKEALLAKAERYCEAMYEADQGDWRFGFWSTLIMEMLIRASASSVSPALLADRRDWAQVVYASGRQPNTKKFSPRSVEITVLIDCVENTFPEFTSEMGAFCVVHAQRRNAEVHSGEMPFDMLGSGVWLPQFYAVCKCLLDVLEVKLEDFFPEDIAEAAETQIKAAADEAAKAVWASINAHKQVWESKSSAEQATLQEAAKAKMTRHYGHRVSCPACSSVAVLHGQPHGPARRQLEEDEIVERQQKLPNAFECLACGLRITGFSKLMACGLGDTFTTTYNYEPMDYFGIDLDEHARKHLMEEDHNEPW